MVHFNTPRPTLTKKTVTQTAHSDDPLVLPFVIVMDHRERAGGWRFDGFTGDSGDKYRPLIVPQRFQHMETADYFIEHEGEPIPTFIERKSHDDFIGSISGGAVNLRKEFERMAEIIANGGFCCMVIESSLEAIIDQLSDPCSERKVAPAAVMGTIASYQQKYSVPFNFCGTRRLAEELALRIFRKAHEKFLASYCQ